jgi:putative membrane protein
MIRRMATNRPFDEATDATRRTRLANERTYLAWWRSGMAAFAVAVGAGKIAPAVGGGHGSDWPYQLLGAGFALLGCAFVGYAYVRQRRVEEALDAGRFSPLDDRVALGLTLATVVLGLATVALVLSGA